MSASWCLAATIAHMRHCQAGEDYLAPGLAALLVGDECGHGAMAYGPPMRLNGQI